MGHPCSSFSLFLPLNFLRNPTSSSSSSGGLNQLPHGVSFRERVARPELLRSSTYVIVPVNLVTE